MALGATCCYNVACEPIRIALAFSACIHRSAQGYRVNIVIIGNGIAGISVAKELRQREPDPTRLAITVIARESYDYYSRIRLPEVFGGGGLGAELLALYKPSWYSEKSIAVRLGQDAVAIDVRSRKIMMSSGGEIPFDRLVLALGADPVRPDIPGAYLPGVFTVREYDDAARVRRAVERNPVSAVVVGGGLLGLEAARHLGDFGVRKLTVLESAIRLLPRQMDERGAQVLADAFRAMGIDVATGVRVARFTGSDRVDGVELEDGREIPAASVVLSMGVRPRIGLAKAAGISTARGIIVDDFLRTAIPEIFAVGDCAEHRSVCLGIIPAALEQAPVCASALLGDYIHPYSGTVPTNTLKIAGLDVFSAGIVERGEGDRCEEVLVGTMPGRYERYLLRDRILVGAIVIGSKERARAAARMMGKTVERELAEPGSPGR